MATSAETQHRPSGIRPNVVYTLQPESWVKWRGLITILYSVTRVLAHATFQPGVSRAESGPDANPFWVGAHSVRARPGLAYKLSL